MMDQNFSSEEFLLKLRNRNQLAVAELVTKYNKQLYNAACGRGLSPDNAEEVLQSTWNAFFEGVHRFEGKSHIRTYLFGILYNKIKEYWRNNSKFLDSEDNEAFNHMIDNRYDNDGRWTNPPIDPERFVWIQEAKTSLDDCINRLGEKYRVAFNMKEVEGMGSEDICNELGLSRTNLGVLIFRAKNLLRECLEKKSITRKDV